LYRQAQVNCHAADDRQLLEILPAEEGHIRLDEVEQFGHHRGNAVEVAGTAATTQRQRQIRDPYGGLETGRVHLSCRGGEDDINAAGTGDGTVALQVARVALQVLARAELDRVDEDREHQDVAAGACLAQQRGVTLVQIAHGRHKGDALAVALERKGQMLHVLDVADNLHEKECSSVGNSPDLTSSA